MVYRLPPAYPALAAAIEDRGCTYEHLGEAVGLPASKLDGIIHGLILPSRGMRQRIARHFGADPAALFAPGPDELRSRQQRIEQGLPPQIEDPAVLRQLATLLPHTFQPDPPDPHGPPHASGQA